MPSRRNYAKRTMKDNSPELPAMSWLFNNMGKWRLLPMVHHPDRCSWCGTKFRVIDQRWFFCPECDGG